MLYWSINGPSISFVFVNEMFTPCAVMFAACAGIGLVLLVLARIKSVCHFLSADHRSFKKCTMRHIVYSVKIDEALGIFKKERSIYLDVFYKQCIHDLYTSYTLGYLIYCLYRNAHVSSGLKPLRAGVGINRLLYYTSIMFKFDFHRV